MERVVTLEVSSAQQKNGRRDVNHLRRIAHASDCVRSNVHPA
jgi:hypothetical protein